MMLIFNLILMMMNLMILIIMTLVITIWEQFIQSNLMKLDNYYLLEIILVKYLYLMLNKMVNIFKPYVINQIITESLIYAFIAIIFSY